MWYKNHLFLVLSVNQMITEAVYNLNANWNFCPAHSGIHIYQNRVGTPYQVIIDCEAAGMWVRYSNNYNWVKVLG